MAIFTNTNRSSSSFGNIVRHGTNPVIADVANLTFNDPIFADGTLVKDATFAQMSAQVYTNTSKSASPTFTSTPRN